MKKPTIIANVILACIMLLSLNSNAQKFQSLDKSPMDAAAFPSSYKVSDKLIRIIYSRPSLKKRKLSDLAPMGKVWRTGANEAAELTLYTTMRFGNTLINAGTYTFYLIPGEKEWTAIISSDLNVWGSYFYNKANDVARLAIPITTTDKLVEAFSIAFEKSNDGIDMHLGWGNMRLKVPFTKP